VLSLEFFFLFTLAYISSSLLCGRGVGVGGGETFGGGTDGGGGRGEFACRFSGFGDPTTATELAALEDEAATRGHF